MFTGGIDNVIRSWDLRALGLGPLTANRTTLPMPWEWERGSSAQAGTGAEIEQETMILQGHGDTITGLALSPDGMSLLSNSMDATLRLWDIRPFSAAPGRLLSVLGGHRHGAEKNLLRCSFSPPGLRIVKGAEDVGSGGRIVSLVAAGSADRNVHLWNLDTGTPAYVLGGHSASVNCVAFHPFQPVVASASSDRCVLVGEIA
jgi:Prp8 binding protein